MSESEVQHRIQDTTEETQADSSGLSRRHLLGGIGALAAAATAGSLPVVLTPTTAEAELGPELGSNRTAAAVAKRQQLTALMQAAGSPAHPDNGDEALYANLIGNYSKGLPHNAIGEVRPAAYSKWLTALNSGLNADFEAIPLGGVTKLTSPQSGLAYDPEGNDGHQYVIPPAPAFASAEEAGEIVENYWMALLRDTRFTDYANSDLAQAAADELSGLTDFRGPTEGGVVTPQTLFRDVLPGCTTGPYVSQFMLLGTPFGVEYVERRMRTLAQGSDHMTSFADWLAVQNGNVPGAARFDSTRRYVRNGRDLSEWVHIDVLFQAYFNACLILGTPPDPNNKPTGGGIGCPLNSGNPYNGYQKQAAFATWGPPFIKATLCEVASRALKAQWYQKWFVHRRLRPEAFAGCVHVHVSGLADYPIHSDALDSEAASRVASKYGTYLLPMAFPEGSPTHPAYGAGHATVAGACVTVLKAFFDESYVIPNPVVPNGNGTQLRRWEGEPLTVGGELNKIASNVGTGRNIAGVHWRSDALESFRLGEAVAIALLRDHKACLHEEGSFTFTKFDGTSITI